MAPTTSASRRSGTNTRLRTPRACRRARIRETGRTSSRSTSGILTTSPDRARVQVVVLDRQWKLTPQLLKLGRRDIVDTGDINQIVLVAPDDPVEPAAQGHGVADDRVEHRLDIGRQIGRAHV